MLGKLCILPHMPKRGQTSHTAPCAYKVTPAFAAGAEWSVLNEPVSSRQRIETVRLYGTNDMSVLRPNFLKMIAAILAYPHFIVQVFFTHCTV